MDINNVLNKLQKVKKSNGGWKACCPAHDDQTPSLSVSVGDNGSVLLYCHAGCNFSEVVAALGLKTSSLKPQTVDVTTKKIVATYDYVDRDGELLYQKLRYEPKAFRLRRPDGKSGWNFNLKGVTRVLYRYDEVASASMSEWVFVCEGEKSADAIRSLGVTSTTNPMGTGEWSKDYTAALMGRRVVILPDQDSAGRKHAKEIKSCLNGVARKVKIVHLPEVTYKSDPYDWVKAGGTKEQLLDMTEQEAGMLWWGDLLESTLEPPPDVVEGFIPGSSLAVFSGDGGIGKSYVLLEMAACVAQGKPWLNMNTTQMPVLIIDLENREWRDSLRVKWVNKSKQVDGDKDIPVAFMLDSDIDLGKKEVEGGLDSLVELIKDHGFGLVILDSFVDFLDGIDENDNAQMALVCKRLRDVADRSGATILAIHHVAKAAAGKAWQSSRGASAIKDNSDCSIQVRRSGEGSGLILTFEHDKARDFEMISVKCTPTWDNFFSRFETIYYSSHLAKNVSSGDGKEQSVLDALTSEWRRRSEVTKEAKDASGLSSSSVSETIRELIDQGVIDEDTSMFGRSSGIRLANQDDTDTG